MDSPIIKSETSLRIQRVFRSTPETLFAAWTDPRHLDKWFQPNSNMTPRTRVDLRVGGAYRIEMHPPDGEPYVVSGVYEEIIPNEKLVFTWQWQAEVETATMRVSILLRALDERQTEMTLLHEQFPDIGERDSHGQGWEGTLANLERYLDS